jgi:ketosteroid isomerase-like protein
MSSDNLRKAEQLTAVLTGRDLVAVLADDDESQRALEAVEPLVEPDFEILMIGPAYTPQRVVERGFEGFRSAWLDWTSPFEAFRIDIDEVIDAGDQVVNLGRQTATTKTGGVKVDADAAAVMTFRDGRISRMEFHLDRAAAMRAAGLEPGPDA